jgi:hypothetical protein
MNAYHIRGMTEDEKAIQKEHCYSERKLKTLLKVLEEQILLWLFPILLLLIIWVIFLQDYLESFQFYIILIVVYLIAVLIGSRIRYIKERQTVISMEKQSEPILEEFRIGQVETCKFQVHGAFILEEIEDEGPTYILDVGNDKLVVICEHGEFVNNKSTHGDTVEIIRLPKSKRILATNWSGSPVAILRIINKQVLEKLCEGWREGDILSGQL